jgi:hypothetical protein
MDLNTIFFNRQNCNKSPSNITYDKTVYLFESTTYILRDSTHFFSLTYWYLLMLNVSSIYKDKKCSKIFKSDNSNGKKYEKIESPFNIKCFTSLPLKIWKCKLYKNTIMFFFNLIEASVSHFFFVEETYTILHMF